MTAKPDVIEAAYTTYVGKPPGSDLAVATPPPPPAGIFGTDDPEIVIDKAVKIANALKNLIVKQGFAKKLKGKDGKETQKEWVFVEGWQTLGAMLDAFPHTAWVQQPDPQTWEARVEIVRRGQTIGAAQALCSRSEWKWKGAPAFSLESMAITRATSKAYRLALGFIMAIAGYETTPGEEMEAALQSEQTVYIPTQEPLKPVSPKPRGRPKAAPKEKPEEPATGTQAEEKPDEERQRVVRKIFALADDYANVGGERGADLRARLKDDDERHKLIATVFPKKSRLRDLDADELLRLVGMLEKRIDEATKQ